MGNIMKQHSILFTLFIPFTVLFILAFAIFMSYFIITESDKAKTDSFITMQNNAITISDNLDAEVTKLDTVSQNIIYSSILKEEFSDYIEYQQSGRGTDAERLHNRETISGKSSVFIFFTGRRNRRGFKQYGSARSSQQQNMVRSGDFKCRL